MPEPSLLVLPEQFPPAWAGGWGEDTRGVYAELILRGVSCELRWIPPGTFRMGSPETEAGRWNDEGPQHLVTLTQGFWLANTPCTQKLWQVVRGDNPSRSKGEQRPVENVDWNQAVAFCQGLTKRAGAACDLPEGFEFRLPTEAEWEYACRAGTTSAFNDGSKCNRPGGKDPALDRLGWYIENSGKETHAVREKLPNAWGLYDLHGNVLEWCADRADWKDEVVTDTYVDGVVDPMCETGSRRVVRGGSYLYDARFCRSACRGATERGSRGRNLGFRLAAGQPPGRGAPSPAAAGAAAQGPEAPAARPASGASRPEKKSPSVGA